MSQRRITGTTSGTVVSLPIGSVCMVYYANIWGILMVNVTINMAYIRIRHGLVRLTIQMRQTNYNPDGMSRISERLRQALE